MIYIIGSGNMAFEYAKILLSLEKEFCVIGRGLNNNTKFKELTGIEPFIGGLEKYLLKYKIEENAPIIVTTGTENLMNTLIQLIHKNCTNILIEKPAAISIEELLQHKRFFENIDNKIYVAYNRRFYSSVIESKKIIENDGGLLSINFEFTEWIHEFEKITSAPGTKENIFFGNSTHVIDLAFYFAGKPTILSSYTKNGNIPWLNKTSFVGCGITEKDVLFSYASNWESAGRWSIELMTKNHRIILKPLESISIQQKGTVQISEYNFNKDLDTKFKPGLYKQLISFLTDEKNNLLSLKDHFIMTEQVYSKILNS